MSPIEAPPLDAPPIIEDAVDLEPVLASLPTAGPVTQEAMPDFDRAGFMRSTWFILTQLGALALGLYVGVRLEWVLAAVLTYYGRMFFITGGYHRYFSHRSYKTSRWFQFVLAFGGTLAAQKGVLWWAGHHRHHHRTSDTPEDIHSPRQKGFFWSHMGWIISSRYARTPLQNIRDFATYPELRWLNQHYLIPPLAVWALIWAALGTGYAVWAGLVSTVFLWHGTFTINSLAHVFGRRRFPTKDDSRNSMLLALITMGEGWHNNHHHYQCAANQGFYWYEIDLSFMILRVLEKLGIVWDLKRPPQIVLDAGRKHELEAAAA
jgi:stearoyl-CoA desaturase (delta-9 desaturase)